MVQNSFDPLASILFLIVISSTVAAIYTFWYDSVKSSGEKKIKNETFKKKKKSKKIPDLKIKVEGEMVKAGKKSKINVSIENKRDSSRLIKVRLERGIWLESDFEETEFELEPFQEKEIEVFLVARESGFLEFFFFCEGYVQREFCDVKVLGKVLSFHESLKILGLEGNPTKNEIKRARNRLAKKFHPDLGGGEEKMKLINEAYETLMNQSP